MRISWRHWAGLLAAVSILAACAGFPEQTTEPPGFLPEAARAAPQAHVVVTVRNDAGDASLGVGSTPRGYSAVGGYGPGRQARSEARALAQRYRLTAVAAWPIEVLKVHCLVYRIADGADREAVLTELRRDERVESAQPLETFNTQSSSTDSGARAARYNDTYAGLQRNLEELAVPEAQHWSRGDGVRVAIIDTGVATDHADLAGRVAGTRNFVDADAQQFRRDRHGTAVAGVIGALANNGLGIVGIAPEVRLLAYKACWENRAEGASQRPAVCNTFTLAQALAAVIEARVDVVNLSLAGPSDPLLARLVRSAQRAGIIFVGAAAPSEPSEARSAKEGKEVKGGFPVNIDGVIGVESSESRSARAGLIAAPGRDIFTLTPADRYDAASGNSLAAAEVSGIVALMRARDARLSAAQARRLLEQSSRPVATDVGTREAIDACAALAALRPVTPKPGMKCAKPESLRAATHRQSD